MKHVPCVYCRGALESSVGDSELKTLDRDADGCQPSQEPLDQSLDRPPAASILQPQDAALSAVRVLIDNVDGVVDRQCSDRGHTDGTLTRVTDQSSSYYNSTDADAAVLPAVTVPIVTCADP